MRVFLERVRGIDFLGVSFKLFTLVTQEHPMTNGVHEANNIANGSANKEIQESSDSAKSEQQVSNHKRELALDLRYYMNRAPVTVSLAVK